MRALFIVIVLCCNTIALAQGAYGGKYRGRFYRQAHMQSEETFVTITEGKGNLEPLMFEARFSARYGIVKDGRPWALTTNPRVLIRMANEKSYPLIPPSYVVDLKYNRMFDKGLKESTEGLAFFGIGHHSNGQSGSFFLPGDTIINTANGNFAQNYYTFGYTDYRNSNTDESHQRFRYIGLKAVITPPFSAKWSGAETLSLYGFYRPSLIYGIGGVRQGHSKGPLLALRKNSQFKAEVGYILGDLTGTSGDVQQDRVRIDLRYYYVLPFFDDISLMFRYYHGQDYYNIRFFTTLDVVTIGFASNIATMKSAIRKL
jgi:hypothetical protein